MAASVPSAGIHSDISSISPSRTPDFTGRPALPADPIIWRAPMKTRSTLILGAIAALGLVLAISSTNALAQQKSPLVGTWQVTSAQLLMSDTKEVLRPYGEHPIGYLQYSPGGHMVTFLSTGTAKRPAGAYTDADRVDIFEGILAAYAATYRVEGNKVIHHVVASWYPERIGRDQIRFFEVDGNRLTIKTEPTRALNWDGREYVATLTFERAE